MLKAIPKRWFSWNFTVMEGSQPVADIDVSWWREKGLLTVQGTTYKVYREGLMSGAFILESAGAVLAFALKPSAFFRSFIIEHAGSTRSAKSLLFGESFYFWMAPEKSDHYPQKGSLRAEQEWTSRQTCRFL